MVWGTGEEEEEEQEQEQEEERRRGKQKGGRSGREQPPAQPVQSIRVCSLPTMAALRAEVHAQLTTWASRSLPGLALA